MRKKPSSGFAPQISMGARRPQFLRAHEGMPVASRNWLPGVPLTIEGSVFGTMPVNNLPYATTG